MRAATVWFLFFLISACQPRNDPPATPPTKALAQVDPGVASSQPAASRPIIREDAAFTGTIFHVAKGAKCSDSGTGTEEKPFCKLESALRKVKAGEKVLVHKGVYLEKISFNRSGKPGKPITIEGEEGATLDGSGIRLDENGLLNVKQGNHLVFRGLTLKGSTFYGVLLEQTSHVVLEKLTVLRSQHGGIIVADSQDIKVLENKVIEANYKNAGGRSGSIHESISITNVKRFEVAKNHVKNGQKEGIDAKDGSSEGEFRANHVEGVKAVGLYLNHATKVKIHKNNVHHCGASGLQFATGDGASGRRANSENDIYENLFWKNGYNGVEFWQTEKGDMSKNRIFNNVLYENKHNGIVLENAVNNTIVNNIIVGNKQKAFEGRSIKQNTRSHNLCYRNGDSSDEGEKVIRADPRFVKPSAGDFRLSPGSPAIDAGKPIGLAHRGKAPDLGAVESK